MRVSEHWLRTFVDPPIDAATLAERLTMAGLEVESSEAAAPPFSRVVVAKILAVNAHPNADRLRVCSVDAGAATLTIVCGAPNASAGMTVPCALEGATLPGGLSIKRTSVRGVESQGMLCSAQELGLAADASGLLALDDTLAPGTDLRSALALDDTVFTLKLTPNRADCLSMLGVARDVSAITGAALAVPDSAPVPATSAIVRDVRIDEPQGCPRFGGRTIEGIDATRPAPGWMKARLERAGLRAISAVVDVTNYVMLELGQPMHAYDARHLDGALCVRFARAGEKLTLLNGDVLDLEPELLLVADQGKPLGLAGIMGGEHSGIADDTTSVFLEGAFWNPVVIQGKMRRLGFQSDAGYRFERGVDFDLGPRAVERATQLILEICGGRAGPLTDAIGTLPARPPVRLRSARVTKLLGIAVAPDAIADIFTRLRLPHVRSGDDFTVTPPSYRFDIAIEEDLVEEVARIYGYDKIPETPRPHVQTMLPSPDARRSAFALRRMLAARDWQEIITFSFVAVGDELALDPAGKPLAVLNPIAAHLDAMRTTLLPGLIGVLQTNLKRKVSRVRVFEVGRVFARDGFAQPLRIGGLAFGSSAPEQWGERTRVVDLFDVKGDLEALAAPLSIATTKKMLPWLHPGRSALVSVNGVPSGWLGELHPRLVRHFDLPTAPSVFELDLAALTTVPLPDARMVSRLPSLRRDIAIVIDENIEVAELLKVVRELKQPEVEMVDVFDVYRGHELPNGRKSVAILVVMRNTERTLTDSDGDRIVGQILTVLADRFGATLRSQTSP